MVVLPSVQKVRLSHREQTSVERFHTPSITCRSITANHGRAQRSTSAARSEVSGSLCFVFLATTRSTQHLRSRFPARRTRSTQSPCPPSPPCCGSEYHSAHRRGATPRSVARARCNPQLGNAKPRRIRSRGCRSPDHRPSFVVGVQ